MEYGGQLEADRVQVPHMLGMTVRQARKAGHEAGVVVVSADVDGPPLGSLTWPGVWIVIAQRPAAGAWVPRWANVVIDFEELRGGEAAGDREPRNPLPDPGRLAVEADSPDESTA
jgi:hypothetical protein